MNIYQLKKTVLTPYIWYMRRKERHQSGWMKSVMELHYYRPALYRFVAATIENQDILHEAPIDSTSVVVDVGAYVGDWAANVIRRYDPKMTYCFEPDPASFHKMAERFAGNPKVRCFDYGLHDRDATLEMEQMGMGSTVFSEGKKATGRTVPVRLRDVALVLEELGHDEIDLFKINIEGGEYEVLERLVSSERMPTIRCLMVQYHEWRDGAHFRRFKLQRKFRRTHVLEWDYPFIWEKWIRRA